MKILNRVLFMRVNLIIILLILNVNISYAQWTKINVDTLGYLPYIPIAADIGEDGDLDIIVPGITNLNSFEGEIILYEAPSWTKHIIDEELSFIIRVIDLNADNKVDIVAGNINAGEVVWYEAPNWTRHVIDTLQSASAVDVIDLDNDGDLDIIASGQRLVWYEAPDWIVHTISTNLRGAFPKAANMDSDNDIDILCWGESALGWYENPAWTFHIIESDPGDINQISLGDFDDDGDFDVLATDASAEQIIWYECPTWTKHIFDEFDYPWGSFMADLDNDNDLDIIITNEKTSEVIWYEAPLWTKHIIDDSLPGAAGLSVADIDDGYIYIVACGFGSSTDTGLVVIYKSDMGTEINSNIISTVPRTLKLHQNYPNPFNPSTDISYSIPRSEFVALKIYDILGREVQTLVRKLQNKGTYSVNFDASELSSGIYYYNLQIGNDFSETKKMLLLR